MADSRLFQRMLLCAVWRAFPGAAHPLPEEVPGMELGSLIPGLIAAGFLITLVLLLTGCVCCKRNKFTQFTNARSNDLPELVATGSVQISNVSCSPIDTGIINPIADREFTIFGPLSSDNYSRPGENILINQELPSINRQLFYNDNENNNPTFENNNGPISPQELENIANNNAENYIVSEYENRNLNYAVDIDPPVEAIQIPHIISSINQQPLNININDESRFARIDNYGDWFEYFERDFPRNQLQYLREIGRGWFGRIVEAEAHNFEDTVSNKGNVHSVVKAAVRILDENVSFDKKCNFLDECKLYRGADHENILKLLGVSLRQEPWLIIFEYCSLGDLKTFLQSNLSFKQNLTSQGIPLKFQCEIASALTYLHSMNVIYPDIACHSCMVMENLSTKLGDYGGSKMLHTSDFYHVSVNNSISLRWTAPECFNEMITKEGNIWAFGIFLWESCTWGTLPYEQLSNEEIISNVMCQNGIRLQQPSSTPEYFTYIYQIMHLCWQYNPNDRITSEQAYSLLHHIYSNYCEGHEKLVEKSLNDFESRWQNLKPNTIPKIDNGYPSSSGAELDIEKDIGLEMSMANVEPDRVSSEALNSTFSEKVKSDSLTNLHGSFESVCDKNIVNAEADGNDISLKLNNVGRSENESLTFNIANCEVAPWLQDLPVTSQEDMSYIKTVSDVISDLDNMLSSEKTSSSESSHQTSPSRDVSKSSMLCDKDLIHSTDSTVNISGGSKDHYSDSKHDVCFELNEPTVVTYVNTNNTPQNVPETSNTGNLVQQDFYPALDFRLAKSNDVYIENVEVHPIFHTKYINTTQDYDSLQDTSYIPNENLLAEIVDTESKLNRQSSSGSETEDEIWKKRIEMGVLTEKIKLKSKSVTDFMVLTHVDMDFTDLESEDTSFISVDGKSSSMPCDKFKKSDLPQKDFSLPTVEYITLSKSCPLTALNYNEVINKPTIDFIKLKRNLFSLTLRNLRPTKSLNDLVLIQRKNDVKKDLVVFKKYMDNFLYDEKDNDSNIDKGVLNIQECDTTAYLKNPEKITVSVTSHVINNEPYEPQLTFDLYDSQSPSLPSEELKLYCALNETSPIAKMNAVEKCEESSNNNESSITINKISPIIERDSASIKPIPENYYVKKLDQVSANCETNDNISIQESAESSNVILGPFSDCTLDLYTGIKTNYNDQQLLSEEEAFMFSSNFNEVNAVKDTVNDCNIKKQDNSAPYFFKSNSGSDRPIDYSIETWDRFLGSSFENDSQNFDSIFPDISLSNEHSRDASKQRNFVENSDFVSAASDMNQLQSYNEQDEDQHYSESVEIRNVLANNRVDLIPHDDFRSLTSKLAIAENENNMNIENLNSMLLEETSTDGFDQINDNESSVENVVNVDVNSENICNDEAVQNCQQNENIENLNNEILLENCLENNNFEVNDGVSTSWFLHIEPNNLNSENVFVTTVDGDGDFQHYDDCDSNETSESFNDNGISIINRAIDPESVKALRDELELKLPLAQKMAQENLSNPVEINKNIASNETFNPTHQRTTEYNGSTNIFNERDISVPDSQVPRNEVLIRYNMYGAIPLSPIQEESWSEFSDMIKAAELEKSDTSNSLSSGQLNSTVAVELPLDKEVAGINPQLKKDWSDDDTNNDSQGLNLTFVILDGGETSNLDKKKSVSIDSLEGIEDNMEIDKTDEMNSNNVQVTELLTFCEDHSVTKSTEEISQNVDNLLQNITITLENASKVGSISSECIVNADGVVEENLSQNNSIGSADMDTSVSHTYVVEGKKVINDITYVCPNKIVDIPDDVSNVSKISQPSLVSDLNTSNISESQMKPSEKSSQMLHTKTASMDSWCSNDTLFNVEENFDDICSFNDFTENTEKEKFKRSVTPTNILENLRSEHITLERRNSSATCAPYRENQNIRMNSVEMVMDYPVNATPLRTECNNSSIDTLFASSLHTDKSSESKILTSSSFDMDMVSETHHPENFLSIEKLTTPLSHIHNIHNDNIEFIEDVHNNSSQNINRSDDNSLKEDELMNNKETIIPSPEINEFENADCVQATSTPVMLNIPESNKNFNLSHDSIDSAQILIDKQFEFLDNMDSFISTVNNCKNFNPKVTDGETLVTDSDFSKNHDNICNLTNKFLEMERFGSNNSEIMHVSESESLDTCEDADEKNSLPMSSNISDAKLFPSESSNQEILLPDTLDNALSSLSYDDFLRSVEKKVQDLTSFELDSSKPPQILDEINIGGKSSVLVEDYGQYNSALAEYNMYTGLNMNSLNCTPSNENLDDLPINSLSYLNFSDSSYKKITSSDNFIDHYKCDDDINHMAPECLKDWDSSSDESNGNSTSSGEFTWKKGDTEEPIVLSASLCTSENLNKNTDVFPANQNFDIIPEEESQSDESGDEEEVEFIPSSWDSLAIPSKSALKNHDSVENDNRKKVAFKKQKYHSVYEYPREIIECEDSPQLPGSSTYSNWQTYCEGEIDPQYEKFIESCSSDMEFPSVPTDIVVNDDDFYISSSTAPFESYSFLNSSSQFFPGQHLSLLNSNSGYEEIDDNELLPLPITEYNISEYDDDDVTNVISNILSNNKISSDFITPDSGTEDVTPGSVNDYEFKDNIEGKKMTSDEIIKNNGSTSLKLTEQELTLNLTNKIKSIANCGSIVFTDKCSSSGSLTPSTPSPSIIGNNCGSGPASPISSSVLGGLRHTRDKLKLDLPLSPLTRNSPTTLSSGRNSNDESKIFDFKVSSDSESCLSSSSNAQSVLYNECNNKIVVDNTSSDSDKTEVLEDHLKNNGDLNENQFKGTLEKFKAYESLDSNSPISPVDRNNSINNQDLNDREYSLKQISSFDSINSDSSTLQKAVLPINMEENSKKSHLEPVKGEGTLLDSGDEDSGIGSSAYTTLERKTDEFKSDNDFISASR